MAALIAGLWAVSLYSYPVFHTLAEMFCLVVAASVFIVVLHMRRLLENHYLLFVGVCFLFVALFAVPHIIAYTGVSMLPGYGTDLPTQAFIVQRLILASTFLFAPLFLTRRLRTRWLFGGLAAFSALTLAAMLLWRDFPHMWIQGVGLTPLNRVLDLVIAGMFIVAAILLARRRASFDPRILRTMLVALSCFAVSDLLFTTYATPFGPSNLVGHLFQVAGFYFIYRAMLVVALVNPFSLLFRELAARQSENERLLGEATARAEQMTLLRELADAGASPLDLAETGRRQIDALVRGLHPQTAVLLAVEDDRVLVPFASAGYPDGYIEEHFGPIEVSGPALSAVAFRTGEQAIVRDIEHDEAMSEANRAFDRSLGLCSAVSLPMPAGDRTLGVVSLGWSEPRQFDDGDCAFLTSVASEISTGVQSAQIFASERIRARRMAALRDIAELGVSAFGARQFGQRLALIIPASLRGDRVLITFEGDGSGELLPIGSTGWSDEELREMTPIPPGSPILEAHATGRIVVVGDTHTPGQSGLMRERTDRFGARTIAVAPMLVAGSAIGTISVAWAQRRALARDEMSFLESLAAEAAVGLQSARLFESERAARSQADAELATTRLLLASARSISSAIDMREVLERFAELALRFTGLTRVFVNLVDEGGRLLVPVIATGGLVTPQGRSVPFERLSRTSRSAIEAKHTALLDFELPETTEEDRAIARANRCRLALFVPLLVGGEIVGHATLDDPSERHAFSLREIELVEGIAAQAALAVRNARLFEAMEHHAGLDRSLAEAAGLLASSLESEAVWPDVLTLACDALDAASGMLLLREPGGWRVVSLRGLPGSMLGGYHEDASTPSLSHILRTREPVFVPDASRADPLVAGWATELGYHSFITCPVLGHGDVLAALVVFFQQERSAIGAEELHVVSRIAFMVGVAEENARLYRKEHEIAETLQEGLLALPSELPGVEFAQAYRSATEGSRVGGDFFDVFQLGDDRIGITIGDVSGKGLSAAVVTALVKNTVRAHATERGKTPGTVLSLTDDVVYRATPPETFVTVFFGMLDRADGHLTYANAAHTTPGIMRADGGVDGLEVTGPLLGAFPNVSFTEAETVLQTGDTLFLYTDGLTEARRDGLFYGEPRVMELLSALTGRTPTEVVDAVVESVEAYTGSRLRDDMAILAIRRAASDGAPSE
jgi:serine phosphatase RsbU (regulator of sigma subunit)